MKSVIAFAFAGLVATVSAQGLSNLPPCALTCLTNGLGSTGCSFTDFKCACSNTAFVSGAATCIQSSCPPEDQQKALEGAAALCASVGVIIPTTFPGSEPTSSAAASSSTVASSSVAISSSAASTSEAPTTGGSTESFPSITGSTTTATLTTNATVVVPTGNVTNTSTAPPVQSTNAAARFGSIGGFAAMGLGLAAYLAV